MRINYYKFPEGTDLQVRIDNGCTKNYDTGEILDVAECYRESRLFEVNEIKLGQNNSRFKYNHHL